MGLWRLVKTLGTVRDGRAPFFSVEQQARRQRGVLDSRTRY